MNENSNVFPDCPRHCDLSAPGCERGESFARADKLPEESAPERRGGPERHGGPGRPPETEGRFRHHGPFGDDRGPRGPEGFCGPRGPEGPRAPHGPGGMHGHCGPGPQRPPRPRGKLTESPRYIADDVNGKLLALLLVLGHAGRHMDGRGGQNRVLSILRESGEMTQRALTERLGIQPGSASEIIGKLERAGFVTRTENPDDRRTAYVSLTEEGKARSVEAEQRMSARREALLSALTEEEKATLLRLLEKLYDSSAREARRPE